MFDSTLNPLWQRYILAVQEEVKPALGCTEPISLALAAAVAAAELEGPVERVEAWVSPNLMKNGLGVTVPGTGMVGLPIAAALGALGGNANAGLEVLKDATAQAIADAKALLAAGKSPLRSRNLAMKSSSHAPKSGTVRSGRVSLSSAGIPTLCILRRTMVWCLPNRRVWQRASKSLRYRCFPERRWLRS